MTGAICHEPPAMGVGDRRRDLDNRVLKMDAAWGVLAFRVGRCRVSRAT